MRHLLEKFYYGAPIARKVAYITILTSAITLFLLSSTYVARNWSVFKEEKHHQLRTLAGIVASSSEAALLFDDSDAANEYIQFLGKDPSIQNAVLYGADGQPFSFFSRSEDFTPPAVPQFEGGVFSNNQISYSESIEIEGRKIGTIYIQMDESAPRAFLIESFGIAIFLVFAGVGLTTILVSCFRKTLTDPITALARLAKDVSKDNDYTKTAAVHYNDEVGSLAESFNEMLKRIKQRDDALRAIQRDLELKVKERTNELEQANQTLLEARDAARAASLAKSNFLSVMSHELRTPMNAIIGMSTLLDEYEISPEKHEALGIIRKSSNALLNLVNDILDYSKIESGRLEIEDAPFDLYPCLVEPAEVVASQSEKSDLAILTDYSPELPEVVGGDQTRLRQIVTNLLSNAMKFTPKGYVKMRAKIVETDAAHPLLEVSVEDTGIGIPEERLSRLFEHFSQVDASTTRRFGGTGLGLAISQRLAKAMGGKITVTSREGVGSCFTLSIPVRQVDSKRKIFDSLQIAGNRSVEFVGFEPEKLESLVRISQTLGLTIGEGNSPETSAKIIYKPNLTASDVTDYLDGLDEAARARLVFACHPSKTLALQQEVRVRTIGLPIFPHNLSRVLTAPVLRRRKDSDGADTSSSTDTKLSFLLVEDNLVNQRVFLLMMKKAGHNVDVANNGRAGLEAVAKKDYDIVFMDYRMPEMDGLEATTKIRKMRGAAETPYILGLTANAEVEITALLIESGMNACLTKPVRRQDLDAAINRYREWETLRADSVTV